MRKKHTKLGIASLIAGFIAIVSSLICFMPSLRWFSILFNPFVYMSLAIVFGYFSKHEDRYGLIGIILGAIGIAITTLFILLLLIALR